VSLARILLVIISWIILQIVVVMGLSLILPVAVITIVSLVLLALVGVLWLLLARERLIIEVKRASLVRVLVHL
jgi:hypothetical protein